MALTIPFIQGLFSRHGVLILNAGGFSYHVLLAGSASTATARPGPVLVELFGQLSASHDACHPGCGHGAHVLWPGQSATSHILKKMLQGDHGRYFEDHWIESWTAFGTAKSSNDFACVCKCLITHVCPSPSQINEMYHPQQPHEMS